MFFLFSRLKFWSIVALTWGLICITSPLVAQTSTQPPDSRSSSTSITFKGTPSFFSYLSRLANFTEKPPTEWIWFDGRRLFQVTALEDYLPKRVKQIETNFKQISNAYFESDNDLRVNVVTVNGSPTIKVNGQYLLTVTKLDAELLGIDPTTWAKQLSQILVAVDIAETDKSAFNTALSLAKTTGVKLMLLNVIAPDENNYPNPFIY